MLWVLFVLHTVRYHAMNVTVFLTDAAYTPNAPTTPDQICSREGLNNGTYKLGSDYRYSAVFFMAKCQDLTLMFSTATNIVNLNGTVLASDSSQLFHGSVTQNIQTPSGQEFEPSQLFWTGSSSDSTGLTAAANCADFTNSDINGYAGQLGSLYNGSHPCNQALPFLCAFSSEGILPAITISATLPQTVYLYATKTVYTGNNGPDFDPDNVCLQEGKKEAKLANFSNYSFQALAFTVRRTSLAPMFAQVQGGIRDLDDNVIAQSFSELVNSTFISRASLRYANESTKFSCEAPFWTGASENSGTLPGNNCGDFTSYELTGGYYGKLDTGLSINSIGNCLADNLPFICAANTVPLAPSRPPVPGERVAYVYLSSPTSGQIINPDKNCKDALSPRLASANVTALLLYNFYPSPVDSVRDIKSNILALSFSEFYESGLRVALAGANFTNNYRTPFWTGAGDMLGYTTGASCQNFSSSFGGPGQVGNLPSGLSINSQPCNLASPLLCAAIIQYPNETFITSHPTSPPTYLPTSPPTYLPTSPPTSLPSVLSLSPPTAAPTTSSAVAPSSSSSTTTVAYIGEQTMITVNGTNATIDISFPADPSLGTDGTVEVGVAPSKPNITVSNVVSIVFLVNGDARNVNNLTNPVVITFPISLDLNSFQDINVCSNAEPKPESTRPLCGFLNVTTDTWETTGCTTVPINKTVLQCRCTHLTDFAIILPKHNDIVPTEILYLTPVNVSAKPTGVIAIVVLLCVFVVLFVLAKRRDVKEAENRELRGRKETKWQQRKSPTLIKQIKIDFQKRHTWFSLIFRKAGTSFQSVDRTFVALLSVFASMSMSANFHAQSNSGFARGVIIILTVCVCLLPSQVLTYLFVHTGEMGFFEAFEYQRRGTPKSKCLRYRFPSWCRHVWRSLTVLAVVAMIIYVLIMSMRFDLQPFFYCQGAPANAWVSTWLGSYVLMALVVDPLRIVVLAVASYQSSKLITLTADRKHIELETMSSETTGTQTDDAQKHL